MHAKRSHTHVNEPAVHVKVQWIMETSKTKQQALKVSGLYNVEVGHYMEEEEGNTIVLTFTCPHAATSNFSPTLVKPHNCKRSVKPLFFQHLHKKSRYHL